MNKLLLLTIIASLICIQAGAQVAVNSDGSSGEASAMLDAKSTDKGFLPPRMTKVERDLISSPAAGLFIYQTDEAPGYYYYNGTDWIGIAGNGTGAISTSSLIDFDGNNYPTITIGNQVWMAANLHVTHYRTGDAIPNITDDATWEGLNSGAFCWYDNDQTNEEVYGGIYNWFAVKDFRGLCPDGWHVPSYADWSVLAAYLGGSSVAGGEMKATNKLWSSPNSNANNKSYFSGLPGGYRNYHGFYDHIGLYGHWWSSTESSFGAAYYRVLHYNNSNLSDYYSFKQNGFSVRCLRD